MFNKDLNLPLVIILLYIALIIIFSLLYYFPIGQYSVAGELKDLKLLESTYFSVVTITTLGYGDILPAGNISRVLVIIESILGVLLIGLFLNAIFENKSKMKKKQSTM